MGFTDVFWIVVYAIAAYYIIGLLFFLLFVAVAFIFLVIKRIRPKKVLTIKEICDIRKNT